MSVLGDFADWTVARLQSQVTYLNDVVAIAETDEFSEVARNLPSAAVIAAPGRDSGTDTPLSGSEVYAYFTVMVWFAADRFRADVAEGLTTTNGIYEMFDDINTALSGETPTSADEPLRYQDGGMELPEDGGGTIVGWAEYQTARMV